MRRGLREELSKVECRFLMGRLLTKSVRNRAHEKFDPTFIPKMVRSKIEEFDPDQKSINESIKKSGSNLRNILRDFGDFFKFGINLKFDPTFILRNGTF